MLHCLRQATRSRIVIAPFIFIRSALPGAVWPAIAGEAEAAALALQYQLVRTQWLHAAELQELQLRQLGLLCAHAWRHVPFFRWHWQGAYRPDEALSPEGFARLPLTRRSDLGPAFENLKSTGTPAAPGPVIENPDAGTAGYAPGAVPTVATDLWERALVLRDHLWHCRDFNGKLATIQAGAESMEAEGWGAATGMIACSGRSVSLGTGAGTGDRMAWLRRHDPEYIQISSAGLPELARFSIEAGIRLPKLREILTVGEPVGPETRALCREAWGVTVADRYSTPETGCLALKCPGHDHHHVQSECVVVELLDERDRPCEPGATGRVVVTTLQNLATPLIRYETGDHAAAGAECPCGRGLPVLRRPAGTPARGRS